MASRIEPPLGILLARIKPGVDIEEYPPSVQAFQKAFYDQKQGIWDALDEARKAAETTIDFTVAEEDGSEHLNKLANLARSHSANSDRSTHSLFKIIRERMSEGIGGTKVTTAFLTIFYDGKNGKDYTNCTRAWVYNTDKELGEFHDTIDTWSDGRLLIKFNVKGLGSEDPGHALSLCFFDREHPGTLIDSNEQRSPEILAVLNREISRHGLTVVFDNEYEVPRQFDPMCATWSLCASFFVLSGFSSHETYLLLVDLRYAALAALSRMIFRNNRNYERDRRHKAIRAASESTLYCVLQAFPSFKCMPDQFMYGDRALGFRGVMFLNHVYWSRLIGQYTPNNLAVLTVDELSVARRVAETDCGEEYPPMEFDGTIDGLRAVALKSASKDYLKVVGKQGSHIDFNVLFGAVKRHIKPITFDFTEASLGDVREALGTESEEVSVESPEFTAAFGTPAGAALAVETFVPDPAQAAATLEQKVLRLPPIFLLTLFAARDRMLELYEPLTFTKGRKMIFEADPVGRQAGYDGGGSTE